MPTPVQVGNSDAVGRYADGVTVAQAEVTRAVAQEDVHGSISGSIPLG
jgi:hypothetical protein